MIDVQIDNGKKPTTKTGRILGPLIGGFIVLAAIAVIGSLAIWALVAIWRGIIG